MTKEFYTSSFPEKIDPTAFVHHKAEVHGCTIGARTRVWQFATVIRGTVLGEDCNVAHGACLDGPKFGDRCIIGHNVAMGPGFEIGDDVFVGPGVVFCNDMWPSVKKDGWSLSAFQSGAVTAIMVGKRCIIGANATLLPGVVLYDDSAVAAGATCGVNVPSGLCLHRDGQLRPIPKDFLQRRMRKATP